jgi:hypothetical protein
MQREDKAEALKEAFNNVVDAMRCHGQPMPNVLRKAASAIERAILIEGFLVDPVFEKVAGGKREVVGIKSLVSLIHAQKPDPSCLFDAANATLFDKKKKQVVVKKGHHDPVEEAKDEILSSPYDPDLESARDAALLMAETDSGEARDAFRQIFVGARAISAEFVEEGKVDEEEVFEVEKLRLDGRKKELQVLGKYENSGLTVARFLKRIRFLAKQD